MSQTTGSGSEKPAVQKPSTDTGGNTGRPVKALRLVALPGVSWLLGDRIEGLDSKRQPLKMTRLRISVLIEGPQGVCEIPDGMIRAIEYE